MFWEQQIQHSTATDVGLRRQNNEDAAAVYLCSDYEEWSRHGHVLVVADGMGGHAVGELASGMAVESVPHLFLKSKDDSPVNALRQAVEDANQAIHSRGTQNPDFLNMGTTCTALVLGRQGATIAHVGDSRAYRVRRDRIDQLTFDHSLNWELMRQRPSQADQIDLLQNRNVITRSLGPELKVQVDMEGPHPIAPGDIYLLCSDGLSNLLKDQEIGAVLRELPVRQAARVLVHLANSRGGPDNITVIVARIGELPANVQPDPVFEPTPTDHGPSWNWMIGFWCGIGILVVGLALLVRGETVGGSIVAALAASALAGLVYAGMRNKRETPAYVPDTHSQTNISRVYRTAVCLSSDQLHALLTEVNLDLQRTARDDGWNIAWPEYDAAVQAAQADAREHRYSKAVRHLARGLDLLMSARTGGSGSTRTSRNVPANS